MKGDLFLWELVVWEWITLLREWGFRCSHQCINSFLGRVMETKVFRSHFGTMLGGMVEIYFVFLLCCCVTSHVPKNTA
jgi:hypothetical protein